MRCDIQLGASRSRSVSEKSNVFVLLFNNIISSTFLRRDQPEPGVTQTLPQGIIESLFPVVNRADNPPPRANVNRT